MPAIDQDAQSVADLAAASGLKIDPQSLTFNEIGLDFRVGFATAVDGTRWVLRLPRRTDVIARARKEARMLELVRSRLPLSVPDWQIFSDALIAYLMLPGNPGLTFDPETYAVT